MAQRVIWAPRASRLLAEAGKHIEIDSPAAARTFVNEVLAAAESLAHFAERGRAVPELPGSVYRELLVGNYRLVYRAEVSVVAVVALIHGSRDFRSWWKRKGREDATK
jgi:plasmid stabilization system protein ParE